MAALDWRAALKKVPPKTLEKEASVEGSRGKRS